MCAQSVDIFTSLIIIHGGEALLQTFEDIGILEAGFTSKGKGSKALNSAFSMPFPFLIHQQDYIYTGIASTANTL